MNLTMTCDTIILDLHHKDDTYFAVFRSVQQVVSAHSVINKYLLECFKIERTQLLITAVIPQFHIITYLNNKYFSYLYIIPYVW